MKNRLLIVCAPMLLLGLALVGCDSGPPKGTVSGTVKLDDKLVTVGNIQFHSKDGKASATASINKDGTYKTTEAPLGTCKVTVFSPPPPKEKSPLATEGAEITIPDKYLKADSTDLSVEVKTGVQTFDISMKK